MPARSRASLRSCPRRATCAPCPAICRIKTPGCGGSTAFRGRGWLNPDFAPDFRHAPLIRALSRWCLGRVSGLKGFAENFHPILMGGSEIRFAAFFLATSELLNQTTFDL